MPSSDYNSIPKVLAVVERLRPRSILDVGCGNGRYGFLFREILDWNYARFERNEWWTRIDGVEVDAAYINDVHKNVYNIVYSGDFKEIELPDQYDLIFMGDVLEHWADGDWQDVLHKARDLSDVTLVVSPNHKNSIKQGSWNGHQHERHLSVLSPERVGGRCLFATSKLFMCGFDQTGTGILDGQDVCL